MKSGLPTQILSKIYKTLESRLLIKPVKSVLSKSKKLYIAYNLTPSRTLTGGPWYSEDDREFDWEFIKEIRNFILLCTNKIEGGDTTGGFGKGVCAATIKGYTAKLGEACISKIKLEEQDVYKVVRTLVLDGWLEEVENPRYEWPEAGSKEAKAEAELDEDEDEDDTEGKYKDEEQYKYKRSMMYVSNWPAMPQHATSAGGSGAVDAKFKLWDVCTEEEFGFRRVRFGENGGIIECVEECYHS